MRKSKADEVGTVLGPLMMDLFQVLATKGVALTMGDMVELMQRAEAKVKELTKNGNGNGKAGES